MKEYQANRRILFVDDEAPVLASFKSLFRKGNVQVHLLQDSTQIWNVLEEKGPFAMVFSDQRMPGLDGVGVLEAVATKHPATIRVMVTGYKDHQSTLRAINIAGISSYIPKPWNEEYLLTVVREGIEQYNLVEEKAYLAQSLESSHESLQSLLDHMVESDGQRRREAAETITALMREKELMLKEIHHRVKNNMQVIASLLNHHASTMSKETAWAVWQKAVARIHSMAMVHQELYESEDFGKVDFQEYLRAQVIDLVMRAGKSWVTTSVEGDGTTIGIDTAVPLGMITHELITNALDHAFEGRDKGSIRIRMHQKERGTLEVCVADDGKGITGNPGTLSDPSGLGLMLVESLSDQIRATVKRTCENGTSYTLTLELAHKG
jgi:two-component sensor histidine kinase/ActR/RegA family two-component response regulator